jgi:transcriptional regulator with XRE-family HTH domain
MRKNLIKWELENGYKSKYVAERLGIKPSEYSLIKNGKRTPSIEFIYKFIEKFPNTDVLELMKKF